MSIGHPVGDTVYIVTNNDYCGDTIEGVYLHKEDAEKYISLHDKDKQSAGHHGYSIDERQIQ